MGFTEKTPEYQACSKLLEDISPRNKEKTDVVDLTSPTEDDTNDNNHNNLLFVKKKNTLKEVEKEKKDAEMFEEEEHGNDVLGANKDGTQTEV